MIAASEEWREPLGVAPWELQLGHAEVGEDIVRASPVERFRVDAGGVPSRVEGVDVGVDEVSELIGDIDVSNNWRLAFGAESVG